jgi:hypothetical protein
LEPAKTSFAVPLPCLASKIVRVLAYKLAARIFWWVRELGHGSRSIEGALAAWSTFASAAIALGLQQNITLKTFASRDPI